MEGNGLRGGVFSDLSPGILGLELSVQPQQQQQRQQSQQLERNPVHHFYPQMVAFARPEPPLHSMKQQQQQQQAQQLLNLTPVSDDEDCGMDDNAVTEAKRKTSSSFSPWQRMKWTDAMVRLLIMAVYYIGDECGSDATTTNNNSTDAARNKKAGALMQKKGKWKSVSKAMMEKGFYVSPQQCEDKFNDLNKRYKRVNEILGKGTACRVVENQSLLDQMEHLNHKSKDEVKKLLNSKHLFFREMCAYHNSCGSNGTGQHQSPSETQQQILHTHHNSSHDTTTDNNNNTNYNPSYDDSEEDDESDEESEQLQARCSTKRRIEDEHEVEENNVTTTMSLALETALRGLEAEMVEVMEDGRRSGWEKKRWMKTRMVKLEEERVGKEKEGLEIEKERLKWFKYCGKKEREMDRKKLKNERAKLECDRMVLLLKHKEMELVTLFKNRAGMPAAAATEPLPPSSVTGC